MTGELVYIPSEQDNQEGEKDWYTYRFTHCNSNSISEAVTNAFSEKQEHTYIVTTPDNDRTPIKATDCYCDEGCLIFEGEDRVTIAVYAPGHWVRVERIQSDENDG